MVSLPWEILPWGFAAFCWVTNALLCVQCSAWIFTHLSSFMRKISASLCLIEGEDGVRDRGGSDFLNSIGEERGESKQSNSFWNVTQRRDNFTKIIKLGFSLLTQPSSWRFWLFWLLLQMMACAKSGGQGRERMPWRDKGCCGLASSA